MRRWSPRNGLLALLWLGLSLLPVWAYFSGFMPSGHNAEIHPMRTLCVADIWRAGQIIPRWSPTLAGGLGYPLFIYYGWAPYAFAALPHYFLGWAAVTTTNITFIVFALILGAGAFALGREAGCRRGAWVAWAVYSFSAYQMLSLYVRASLPEYAGGALAPWVLWGMIRVARGTGAGSALAAGVALALLMFTHNVSAFLFGPLAVAAGVWTSLGQRDAAACVRALVRVALVTAAGLAMSAFFWVPLVLMREAVDLRRVYYNDLVPETHFVEPWQLFWSRWDFGYSVAGPGDGMSFRIGAGVILSGLAGLAGVILALRRKTAKPAATADNPEEVPWPVIALPKATLPVVLVAAGVLLFLTTRWSAPVWEVAWPLRLIQFPWRLLLPATLLLALAGAMAVKPLHDATVGPGGLLRQLARRVHLLLAGFAIVTALPLCQPLTWMTFDDAELRRVLERVGVSTTVSDDYRPARAASYEEVRRRVPLGRAMVAGVPGARLPPPAERMRFTVEVAGPPRSICTLPVYYFPGWRVETGTVEVVPQRAADTGLLTIVLPGGSCRVTAWWEPTSLQWLAAMGSFLSAGLFAILCVFARLWTERRSAQPPLQKPHAFEQHDQAC